jgi:hypothetical protein
MQITAKRVAAVTWATTAAIAANQFLELHWWHPYCRDQADGPGYYAIGLPLPYAQPTGASSLEYFVMPHVYAIDLLTLAGVVSLLILRLPGPLAGAFRGRVGVGLAIVGSVALLLVASLQTLIFTTGWWPVTSIATKPDGYLDYRPAFMVDIGRDHQCYD